MNTFKSIYMPVRRYFFLDDSEEFHRSDKIFMVGGSSFTAIVLLICFAANLGN